MSNLDYIINYNFHNLISLKQFESNLPSVVNIIELIITEKYKTINVKCLVVFIEPIYFQFTTKYAYIYKYLSILRAWRDQLDYIMGGGGAKMCTLIAATLWLVEFLYSIMGNVVFNHEFYYENVIIFKRS